jgi:uncharacterized protein YkwD
VAGRTSFLHGKRLALAVIGVALAGVLAPLGARSATAAEASPVTGFAVKPDRTGYWLVSADGDVAAFGTAADVGGMESSRLNKPIVGMAPTAKGAGYWLVASDGGIFAFGDAAFHGSTGAMTLNRPIVDMAATPTGRGYWLVASDGGIFGFGDAGFFGSTGSMTLVQPITAMAATPTGKGYWLVASDGGIFAFGDASFHGSGGGRSRTDPIVGMAATASGVGSWMVTQGGQVLAFGDAPVFGTAPPLTSPAVGITRLAGATGYQIASADGTTVVFTAAGVSVTPGPAASTKAATIAREVFDLLNSERAARGLAPLTWDPQLAGLAQQWADQLAATDTFVHRNLGATLGSPGFAGIYAGLGENIATGSLTSGWAHQLWMSSSGHRANMLQPGFDTVGIGIVCDANGQMMAVENFGRLATTTAGPMSSAAPPATPILNNTRGGTGC